MDSAPIKEAERKKCQAVQEKIDAARCTLEVHETISAPEYLKWLHSHYGQQLTEIRELSDQVLEKHHIIEAVLTEAYLTGCSKRQAYRMVMEEMSRIEAQAESDEDESPDQDSSDRSDGSSEARQEESQEKSHKSGEDENSRQDQSHWHQHRQQSKPEPSRRPSAPFDARAKDLYRKLVRKLHPDLNPDLESNQRELWHQVQEAYQAQHVERLESLTAMSEMLDGSWEQVDAVSSLKKLFQHLLSSLKQLEKRIREARKDPAWRFHEIAKSPTQLEVLKISVQQKLTRSMQEFLSQQEEMDAMIEEWSAPRKRKHSHKERRNRQSSSRFKSDSHHSEVK